MKPLPSIEFKGTIASLSALAVILRSNEISLIAGALDSQSQTSPDFFNEDIVLLDANHLPDKGEGMDWPALVALFRQHRLNPVIVRNASAAAESVIRKAGLTLAEHVETNPRKPAPEEIQATPHPAQGELDIRTTPEPATKRSRPSDAPPPAAAPSSTVVIERPLRSGQQVYARNADLVVLAMVNPGAEIMADGNIHVYAPLRGRALAGASGNTGARILTTSFEAELVSIGGVYRPLEPGTPKEVRGKPTQVRLTTDEQSGKQSLMIEPLKIS